MTPAREQASLDVSQARVLRGSLVVAVGLLSAQIAGFIRQLVIGYLLGTGSQADALSAAMAPLEVWWSVLAISVIYGFAPRFVDPAYPFGSIFRPLSLVSVASTVLFFVFAWPLVRLFAPGLDVQTTALGVELLRVFSLAAAAIGSSFVYAALLFSRRRFAVPSFQHATVNFATVVGALALFKPLGVHSFAVGYVAGAWIQLGLNYLSARPILAEQNPRPHPRGLADLFTPAPIAGQALALELNTAVTRAYASTFGSGMTAAFDFGFKVFRVPMALLVVPLAQSLLPEISSRQAAAEDREAALRAVKRAAVYTSVTGAAAAGVMMVMLRPIVSLLFERGEFGADSTTAVVTILLGYMPVMMGRSPSEFLSRALFAMQRYRVPLQASLAALFVNLVVCILLPDREPLFIGLGAVIGFIVAATLVVMHVARLDREDGRSSPTS